MFKCIGCNREFSSRQSLDDHNKSKHFREMDDKRGSSNFFKNKYFLIIIGLVIFFLVLLSTPIINFSSGKYDDFAKCVSDSGAKMYGAYWCAHCAQQKKSFGSSFKKLNYIECSLPNNAGRTQVCDSAGIQSYPTWEFGDGTREEGVLSLEKISKITGCNLPQ